MDDRMIDYLLRVAAGALTVIGVVAVLIGYLGVRDESDLALQVPYLVSGGLGGLALIGLGALALIQYQMRVQSRRFIELTESLDEWKDAALAEVRGFLEGAELEVEVRAPTANGARATRARPSATAR
jgi:hypothetical protein